MKLVTVIGARPQFIKAAVLRKPLLAGGHREILVHTGQHYDYLMSKVFFEELDISEPDYNLEVGAASPLKQMGVMMEKLEEILAVEKPDCVLVYGDTNSTLAASLTAVKSGIPVAHVEGGERNFRPDMTRVHPASIPEETNRVMTDAVSSAILCASRRAVENLKQEGITEHVSWTGDIMLESFLESSALAARKSEILQTLDLTAGEYILATIHRAINTDNPLRLKTILAALLEADEKVIFPIHPRTRKCIAGLGFEEEISRSKKLTMIEPLGYFDMLALEQNSRLIVTDSGGVTREAFFSRVPGVIVDDTTAWIDLVLSGWCRLTGADGVQILTAARNMTAPKDQKPLLGQGHASEQIVLELEKLYAR